MIDEAGIPPLLELFGAIRLEYAYAALSRDEAVAKARIWLRQLKDWDGEQIRDAGLMALSEPGRKQPPSSGEVHAVLRARFPLPDRDPRIRAFNGRLAEYRRLPDAVLIEMVRPGDLDSALEVAACDAETRAEKHRQGKVGDDLIRDNRAATKRLVDSVLKRMALPSAPEGTQERRNGS